MGDPLRESPSAPSFVSELARRVLLGVLVALLTARILAPGEDPGMLQAASGPTSLLMPLLWLLAGLALAAWRLGRRNGDWRGGLVEGALLIAIAAVFIAAELAVYKHPARLIAWDWLTLFVVVCLVRMLAASPADRQGLLAVFLAGATALSAQAVYQAVALAVPATATFAQPAPFLAWLALFLPGLFAAHVVCHVRRARWLAVWSGLGVVLGASAVGLAFVAVQSSPSADPPLADVWPATGRMIAAHPLGVGPGEFSRAYPAFQPPGGDAVVADPHNFVLEIAATGGIVALLAVLTALGAFFVKAVRWLRKPVGAAEQEAGERTRWEYYIGGMCGLVLGFIIRQTNGDHTPDEILLEGFVACGRCIVWLIAFLAFERVPWPGRVRAGALTGGVAALLLVLLWNPGFGLPSVAVPLWAAVALALNELSQRDYPAVNALALTRVLPFFVVLVLAVFYFLDVFVPVTSCSDRIQQAVREGAILPRAAAANHVSPPAQQLRKAVLAPLEQAAKDYPDDVRVKLLLAGWNAELWSIHPLDERAGGDGVSWAQQAEQLDPQNPAGYGAEYRLRMGFGQRLELDRQRSLGAAVGPAYRLAVKELRSPHPLGRGATEKLRDERSPGEPAYQYLEAAEALEKYQPYDPNDAVLRFRLAEARYKAWQDDRCREQAKDALRLDVEALRKPLNEEQRQKLEVWKELPPAK